MPTRTAAPTSKKTKDETTTSSRSEGASVKDEDVADLDENGFPMVPAETAPSTKSDKAKKSAPVSDEDFMNSPPPPVEDRGSQEHTTKKKGNTMADTAVYSANLDPTTPETMRTSLREASDEASSQAVQYQEQADSLRAEAAGLEGNKGMAGKREQLLRAAEKAETEAQEHRGMASGYQAKADSITL